MAGLGDREMLVIDTEPAKKVKIFGVDYELRPLQASDIQYLSALADKGEKSTSETLGGMLKFIVASGLPEDVCSKLPASQVGPLFEYLVGSKKN